MRPPVVNGIVEIAKGRRSKFEMDKETGMFRLDRYLYSSLHYPGDYGFIPHTLAEDGDPLDILVMVNEPTFTGCLIEARPIGLFKMTDRGVNDYKVLAVPNSDPTFDDFHDLWRVPPHFLREVEHFFATYKQLEEAIVVTQGWESSDKAKAEIEACVRRYEQTAEHTAAQEQAGSDAPEAVDPITDNGNSSPAPASACYDGDRGNNLGVARTKISRRPAEKLAAKQPARKNSRPKRSR